MTTRLMRCVCCNGSDRMMIGVEVVCTVEQLGLDWNFEEVDVINEELLLLGPFVGGRGVWASLMAIAILCWGWI